MEVNGDDCGAENEGNEVDADVEVEASGCVGIGDLGSDPKAPKDGIDCCDVNVGNVVADVDGGNDAVSLLCFAKGLDCLAPNDGND